MRVRCRRRDPGICVESLLRGIVEDVEGLVAEVFLIDNAVCVVAILPNLTWEFFADGEGESALDELGAAFDGHVRGRGEQDVDVVGHDDESVELESAGVAIAEECVDEEFGGCGALEEATTLVSYGSEGVGLGFEAHGGRACPGG
jgi:hypothetical protein